MYELRYYSTLKDLSKQTRNYELVGCYYERQLANGMRIHKALEPQYKEELLKVIMQSNIKSYALMQKRK